MRMIACLLFVVAVTACSHPRNGDDGMDGYGVAVGLRHELDRDTP